MEDSVTARNVTADGVAQGYSEAMVSSKTWKVTGGRMSRPWATRGPEPKGLTGGALEAALKGIALQFPGNVSI